MVSVICCSIREQFMENVFENFDRQTMKKKEFIIILNGKDMDAAKWLVRAARSKDVSVYKMPYLTLGECLNFGIEKSRYNTIAKFDDDDYYAPNYLARQVRYLQRKGADMVCKRTVFMYFEEEKTLGINLAHMKEKRFIQRNKGVKGSTLVFRVKLWNHVKFHPINVGEDTLFIKECLEKKFKIFATDRYNYLYVRKNEKHHTWKARNEKLMNKSKLLYVLEGYKQALANVSK